MVADGRESISAQADNAKAKRGHSKEKRSDGPLTTLRMVLDGSGFVRRSEVFDGNVSEGQTLEQMLSGLKARVAQRIEDELAKIAEGLSKPRTTKRIDKLWEHIGRLKAKSRGVGQHDQIEWLPVRADPSPATESAGH